MPFLAGLTKGTPFDPKNSYADRVRDRDVAENPGATPLETATREPVFYGAARAGQKIGQGVEATAETVDKGIDKTKEWAGKGYDTVTGWFK